MRRGDNWLANLNPPRGRETGKMRPVLVVQSDELLAIDTPLVVVLPLTTQLRPGMSAWRVHFAKRQRLLQDSQIVIDQPRALDRERLIDGPLAVKLTARRWKLWTEVLRPTSACHSSPFAKHDNRQRLVGEVPTPQKLIDHGRVLRSCD